ncbi:efflux RND transporter periplasmic adaptor subunit [Dyella amyloliquefaciens]|uniref:efflux RND transporter periplasmic adaptor subunit n=1 Tax=Dyella amyloliquefaciens TaxID=1770545 RepID=UPI00102EA86F|nr:efflux RND transporter periplasmic adaptor subunit [Dyella amyloliquefaciens]
MMFRQPWFVPALAALMLAACSSGEAPEETAVSAAVTTVPVHQGSLPELVVAYGTAGPSADAAHVMNVQAAGHVAKWDVTAGLPVKRGQPLLTFALAPSSVAAYQQALSAQKVAAEARAHTNELFAQQLATRDQKEQADKALQDAQSNLDALVQQQGRNPTMEVVAPFDGTVVSVDAAQGDLLQPGAPLLTIQRGDGLVVTVGMERDAMERVQSGAGVTLTPLDAAEPMHGTVRRVARALNPHTHQLDVEVVPDGALVNGESFRADITVGQWQGWLVPRDALQGDETDRYVFQVADGKAAQVPVKVLGESDSESVVSGAVDAHRPLVTIGATQLDDGMTVRTPAADAKP